MRIGTETARILSSALPLQLLQLSGWRNVNKLPIFWLHEQAALTLHKVFKKRGQEKLDSEWKACCQFIVTIDWFKMFYVLGLKWSNKFRMIESMMHQVSITFGWKLTQSMKVTAVYNGNVFSTSQMSCERVFPSKFLDFIWKLEIWCEVCSVLKSVHQRFKVSLLWPSILLQLFQSFFSFRY